MPGQLSAPIAVTGLTPQTSFDVFVDYIKIGFVHILPLGFDHILFVLGLFFFDARLKPLLIQVTLFTVAHTVTLALATTGLVAVSPAVIEPLIAASIVYVAVENLWRHQL
ncbi:MAG: HupE/UreJ family protein, partial [Candidatus Puniceispirillum sp.]